MKNRLKFNIYANILLIILIPAGIFGQISYGEKPFNWDSISKKDIGICGKYIPPPDLKTLLIEDSISQLSKSNTYRFGVELEYHLNNENSGIFHYQPNGDRIWYLPIRSNGALTLSVHFGKFKLSPGAKVFIWDQKKKSFLGAFTHQNNKPWGSLATGIIGSDRIVVEVYEPKKTIGYNEYEIDEIVYGYRSILGIKDEGRSTDGPFGESGDCNVNISCPEGNGWEQETGSVVLVVNGGTVPCSGALINNTNQDGLPYLITAEHCLNGNLNDWIIYFNFQSEQCSGDTGPINQSISGCTFISGNEEADIGLLLLSEDPPDSYNVCFSGWDRSDLNNSMNAVGIHHPNGDIKKICIENDGLIQTQWQGFQTWQCDDWDVGVTEIGSSGSPLFNDAHQIIGTLSGGEAFCSGSQDNGQPDWYGRIGVAWDGSIPETRLRDWLDPGNTQANQLNTLCPNSISYTTDVQIIDLVNFPEYICDTAPFNPVITIKNNGITNLNSIEFLYAYNESDTLFTNWYGDLQSQEETEFILPAFSPQNGTNSIYIEALSINTGIIDENSNNNSLYKSSQLNIGFIEMNVALLTDDFGYETYWEIRNEIGDVLIFGGNSDMGISGAGDQSATPSDVGAYENNTWYYETYLVPQSQCYEFEIADDFGDGICCDFGEGQYSVLDQSGQVLAEGGQFGTHEITVSFMESELVDIQEAGNIEFKIFPNPADHSIQIILDRLVSKFDVNFYNNIGQLVKSQTGFSNQTATIDVQHLQAGIYHVEIKSEEMVSFQKLMIK